MFLVVNAFTALAHGRERGACVRAQAQACPTACRGNVPWLDRRYKGNVSRVEQFNREHNSTTPCTAQNSVPRYTRTLSQGRHPHLAGATLLRAL